MSEIEYIFKKIIGYIILLPFLLPMLCATVLSGLVIGIATYPITFGLLLVNNNFEKDINFKDLYSTILEYMFFPITLIKEGDV